MEALKAKAARQVAIHPSEFAAVVYDDVGCPDFYHSQAEGFTEAETVEANGGLVTVGRFFIAGYQSFRSEQPHEYG